MCLIWSVFWITQQGFIISSNDRITHFISTFLMHVEGNKWLMHVPPTACRGMSSHIQYNTLLSLTQSLRYFHKKPCWILLEAPCKFSWICDLSRLEISSRRPDWLKEHHKHKMDIWYGGVFLHSFCSLWSLFSPLSVHLLPVRLRFPSALM